jgi:hypothetical protein
MFCVGMRLAAHGEFCLKTVERERPRFCCGYPRFVELYFRRILTNTALSSPLTHHELC